MRANVTAIAALAHDARLGPFCTIHIKLVCAICLAAIFILLTL